MGIARIDDLTVVIQAGGESKRMGSNKSVMPFLGAPLIMRGVRRLFPICTEMVITSNEPEKLDFLEPYIETGRMRIAADRTERRGALIGMVTAFENATMPYVAMVACDMVFPSAPLIAHLRERLEETGADVAIPRTSHGYEPFHAVYRRESCLTLAQAALEAGESKATSWLKDAAVLEIGEEEIMAANPRGAAFVNVNTPDDLHALEQKILNGEIKSLDEDD